MENNKANLDISLWKCSKWKKNKQDSRCRFICWIEIYAQVYAQSIANWICTKECSSIVIRTTGIFFVTSKLHQILKKSLFLIKKKNFKVKKNKNKKYPFEQRKNGFLKSKIDNSYCSCETNWNRCREFHLELWSLFVVLIKDVNLSIFAMNWPERCREKRLVLIMTRQHNGIPRAASQIHWNSVNSSAI